MFSARGGSLAFFQHFVDQAVVLGFVGRHPVVAVGVLFDLLDRHAGVPIKKIEKDADRDYWMTADEAKNYGLIDEVLKKRK